MTTHNVANTAGLAAALSSAIGGDEILMAPGDYTTPTINGKSYGSTVTVKSQDALNQARINGQLKIQSGCGNIDFEDIEVVHGGEPLNSTNPYVRVKDSQRINLRRMNVHGPTTGDLLGGIALDLSGDTDCGVYDSHFDRAMDAMQVAFGTRIVVSGNTIDALRRDWLKFWGCDGLDILNNFDNGLRYPQGTDHNDGIQGQGDSQNVTVRGNIIRSSGINPETQQGCFNRIINVADGTFRNFLIEDNVFVVANGNHIFVEPAAGNITIRRNGCLFPPFMATQANPPFAMIVIQQPQPGLTLAIENNVIGMQTEAQAGIDGSNNHYIHYQGDPNSPRHYSNYFPGLLEGSMPGMSLTLEQLRPKPGGPADFGSGLGPEARILELIGSGGAPVSHPVHVEVADAQGQIAAYDTTLETLQ